MNILLVAVKKSFTKKWLSPESPTLNAWMDITKEIYKMEQITAFSRYLGIYLSHTQSYQVQSAVKCRYIFVYHKNGTFCFALGKID